MKIDLPLLHTLLTRRSHEIDTAVIGTGYLAKTVCGVATFLLDNEGDTDLLTARQQATFDRFIRPLLSKHPGKDR